MITRDQFIMSYNAIEHHYASRKKVEGAAEEAGLADFCLGSSPVANALEQTLGAWCRVREDENGPWPADSCGEDDLSLALHWADIGTITDGKTGEPIRDFPTTAEGIWEMWERERTGPFRPARPVLTVVK